MTERPASKLDAANDDYRQSHLQRGGSYDATLATTPFDAYMAQLEREYLLDAVPSLFPAARPRYLDFACGTGRITQTVAPLAAEAIGVDISPSMLQEAQRKCPSVRFVQADLTRAEVDLGNFDLITSFRFFGNAQDELRVAVLRTLNRLLREGGYLIINSHRNPRSIAATLLRLSGVDAGLDLHYPKLQRLLREHGFEVARTRPIGAWMYRAKLMAADPQSARARRLEALFSHSVFTAFAPDAVVVARKTRSL
jgi:ubiquinone/menaquinone biosynthesis C-methylase UbiE